MRATPIKEQESYYKLFSWGNVNKGLFTPNKEPSADQRKDTAKVQLGEPCVLLGVIFRNMDGGITYRSRNDSVTAAKTHPSMSDSSPKLGTWSTVHISHLAQLV